MTHRSARLSAGTGNRTATVLVAARKRNLGAAIRPAARAADPKLLKSRSRRIHTLLHARGVTFMSALLRPPHSLRAQRGVTLVETLVTLVSTSVGLLGVAALHLVSLRTNHDANVRLQASTLAGSVLERIRADRAGYLAGEYADVEFNGTGAPGTSARIHLATWQQEIDRQLPGGQEGAAGAIQHDERSPVVTVTIRWRDNDGVDSATPYVVLSLRTEI